MRHTMAMLLALGIGLSAVAPAAFAAEREGGQDTAVATVAQLNDPGDPGMIAGPNGPAQFQTDDRGHDRN